MKKENNDTNLISTKERLNKAIAYLKGQQIISTQKNLAEELGVYTSNLSKAIKGDEKYLTNSFLEKFSDVFEIDINWLLTGQGEMINEEKPFKEEVHAVPFDDYMVVEYADLSTSAGLLGGNLPENLPETKKKLLPKEFEEGNYLVVKVDGDSMDDGSSISIPDGTEILIKEYTTSLNEKIPIRNNLFVIVSREGTVFKQIVEHNLEDGYIMCRSYNKKYDDYPIELNDILQIFIYRKIVSLRPSIPSF